MAGVGRRRGRERGRWLWVLFARQIYAVPEPTVPVVGVVLVGVGALYWPMSWLRCALESPPERPPP
jgi:hypothetical protein